MKTATPEAPKRRSLFLERLEDRIMLDVTLLPGTFTYFDLIPTGVADADDMFIANMYTGDGAGEIFVEAAADGQSMPTGIYIRGGHVRFQSNHSLSMPVFIEGSAGDVEIYLGEFDFSGLAYEPSSAGLPTAPDFDVAALVGGHVSNSVWAQGADIAAVHVAGSVTDTGVIRAEYRAATGGGSIGDIHIAGNMTGRIEADYSDARTQGTIDSVTIEGNLGRAGKRGAIWAYELDSLHVEGNVANAWIPQTDSLTVEGRTENLWVMGELGTGDFQEVGYLTVGGHNPHAESEELRWNAGDISMTRLENQLWVWGDLGRLDISEQTAAFAPQAFVDGMLGEGIFVQAANPAVGASFGSIHVGGLSADADIILQGRLAGESYIFLTGATNPANPDYRLAGTGGMDASNTISVWNNELRLFSRDSLGDGVVLTGNHNLTDATWNAARDFWHPAAGAFGTGEIWQVQPAPNPGAGFADASAQHQYVEHAGLKYAWTDYSDANYRYEDPATPVPAASIYGNYYYRGFRIVPVGGQAYASTGPANFTQEFLTFVSMRSPGTRTPYVEFTMDQGRLGDISAEPNRRGGHAAASVGIESSTALSGTVHVVGNLSFVYVHGTENYRGDIYDIHVQQNAGGQGSLLGAAIETYNSFLYTGANVEALPGASPITADPRHIRVAVAAPDSLLAVYARRGAIGTRDNDTLTGVRVAGDLLGDVVADFGGIRLVQAEGVWGRTTEGRGGLILARGQWGDISRIRAGQADATMTAELDYRGAAVVAEGRIGIADDWSHNPGAANDLGQSDWAIWVGQGAETDGAGYIAFVSGSADGVRFRLHAEVNDLWSVEITGAQGFGTADIIDLPFDNDLYLQVANGLNWDPNHRNDYTRDANGYPVNNRVLIGQRRNFDAVGNIIQRRGLGDAGQAEWSFARDDVAVARRFTALEGMDYNLYFFNEGFLDGTGATFDDDGHAIEFVQYVSVGGDTTVDQYIYQGQIDRIEFIDGPAGANQGVAVLVTTKSSVPLDTVGFEHYGRILGSGANILLVAADGDLREVRVSGGNDLVGTPFGLTHNADPANPDPALRRMGFLTLAPTRYMDWDGDGTVNDRTAVAVFRGTVRRVFTAEGGSNLTGDIVVLTGDIEVVDASQSPDPGTVIDIVTPRNVFNVNIRNQGGTLNVSAGGLLHTVVTQGDIGAIRGGSQGVDTFISAAGTIGQVEITSGAWRSGDRIYSGESTDLFMTVKGGFEDGTVVLGGGALVPIVSPETAPLSFWLFDELVTGSPPSDDFDMWITTPGGELIRYFNGEHYVQDDVSGPLPDRAYWSEPETGDWIIQIELFTNNNPGVDKVVWLEVRHFGATVAELARFTVPGDTPSASGSGVFVGDPNGYVYTYTGSVGSGAYVSYTLENHARVGEGRYFYVDTDYAQSDRQTTPAPYAGVQLDNALDLDDEVIVSFGAGEGQLNSILVSESTSADFAGPPAGVDRDFRVSAGAPVGAFIVDSDPEDPVRALRVTDIAVGGSNIFLAAARSSSFDFDGDGVVDTNLTLGLPDAAGSSWDFSLFGRVFATDAGGFNTLFYRVSDPAQARYEVALDVSQPDLPGDPAFGMSVAAEFSTYQILGPGGTVLQEEHGHLTRLVLNQVGGAEAPTVALANADFSATTIEANLALDGIVSRDVRAGDMLTGGIGGLHIFGDLAGPVSGQDIAGLAQILPFIGRTTVTGDLSVDLVAGEFRGDLTLGTLSGVAIVADSGAGGTGNMRNIAIAGGLSDSRIRADGDILNITVNGLVGHIPDGDGNNDFPRISAGGAIRNITFAGGLTAPRATGTGLPVIVALGQDQSYSIRNLTINGDANAPFTAASSPAVLVAGNIGDIVLNGNTAVMKFGVDAAHPATVHAQSVSAPNAATTRLAFVHHDYPNAFFGIWNGVQGNVLTDLLVQGTVGMGGPGNVLATSMGRIELHGVANQALIQTAAGDINEIILHSSLTQQQGRIQAFGGNVGNVTVHGSLTGPSAELGGQASPVIWAGGSIGLITVGSAAPGETLGGRFVAAGEGAQILGFNVDQVETIAPLLLEGSLGSAGLRAAPGVRIAGLTVEGDVAGPVSSGQNLPYAIITGSLSGSVRAVGDIVQLELGALAPTGLVEAGGSIAAGDAIRIGAPVAGGTVRAGVSLGDLEIAGAMSGGSFVAQTGAIGSVLVGGPATGGTVRARTDLGDLEIAGAFGGGTFLAETGAIGAVSIQGPVTGGTVRARTDLGDLEIVGDMGGGSFVSETGTIGSAHVQGDMTGGRIAALAGSIASLKVDGDLNVPFDVDDPDGRAAVEARDGFGGAVEIGGDALGWVAAGVLADGSAGFAAGVTVGGDVLELFLDGDVHPGAGGFGVSADGRMDWLSVGGDYEGDLTAGEEIALVIVHGNLRNAAANLVNILAPIDHLVVHGAIEHDVQVAGPTLFLSAGQGVGAASVIVAQPDTNAERTHVLTLDDSNLFDVDSGGENFFFYFRNTAPLPGAVEVMGEFRTVARSDRAEVSITLAQSAVANNDWIPTAISVAPVLPAPLLLLSFQTNTRILDFVSAGDIGDLRVLDAAGDPAPVRSINIAGHVRTIVVERVEDSFDVGDGMDDAQLGHFGLYENALGQLVVSMQWGGETHEVDPDHLLNPSAHGIPYDATFTRQITLGGALLGFTDAMIYADITLPVGVRELLNPGGTFYGDITAMGDVDRIVAENFGTGGYTAGPDGKVDFDNVSRTNAVQGTFDDVFLNTITVNGSLGQLVARVAPWSPPANTANIYAQVVVTGDLHEVVAEDDIEGSIAVAGALGRLAPLGEARDHPLTGTPMVELDGIIYSPDDLLTGVVAGGDIFASVQGASVALVKAGGDIGRSQDWISDAQGAVNRHLIEATEGDIGVVWAGNNLHARINAAEGIDYILADGHIRTANRRNVVAARGSATNMVPGTDIPLINASSIGYIFAGGTVAGSVRHGVSSGEVYEWQDASGEAQFLRVLGGEADVVRAFGSVVRVDMSTPRHAQAFSTGNLGVVTNASGPISVVVGAWHLDNRWLLPSVANRAQYGLGNDPVFTTGNPAGVLGVRAGRGDVIRVLATGDVGSVVSDNGTVRLVDVIDGHLGLVVDGTEFTVAQPGQSDAGVYGARGIGTIRVLPSTDLTGAVRHLLELDLPPPPEQPAPGQQPEQPVPQQIDVEHAPLASWLRGTVESGGDIVRMNLDNLAAGTAIHAAGNIRNVQVVHGTGNLLMGLYRIEDPLTGDELLRPEINAGGSVFNVRIGAMRGLRSVVVSDSLIDIRANGFIRSVIATGDILGDIGTAGTTFIHEVRSLSGSIGRQDLAENDILAPTIWTSGVLRHVSAFGDIYAHMYADRIFRVVSDTGTIGRATLATAPVGQPEGIVSNTHIHHLVSNNGFGATVTTGLDLFRLEMNGGAMSGTLNVGRHLRWMRLFGSGGDAIVDNGIPGVPNIDVGGSLFRMQVFDGSVGGVVNVADRFNVLFVRNEGRNAVTGAIDVGGRLANANLTGNVARDAAITANGGIARVLVRGTMRGTVNVNNGNLGVLRAINPGGVAIDTGRGPGQGIFVNNGDAGAILANGHVRDSLFSVSRMLRRVHVSGDFRDSSIEADRIGLVAIRGTTDGVGFDDVIHAADATSRFVVVANRQRRVIDAANEFTFEDGDDGVRAFVG